MNLFPFRIGSRRPADLSIPRFKAAIPKLERLLMELHEVDLDDWNEWRLIELGMQLEELMDRVRDSLAGVFGRNSLEYHRLTAKLLPPEPRTSDRTRYEAIEAYGRSTKSAIQTMRTAIRLLHRKLDQMSKPPQSHVGELP